MHQSFRSKHRNMATLELRLRGIFSRGLQAVSYPCMPGKHNFFCDGCPGGQPFYFTLIQAEAETILTET